MIYLKTLHFEWKEQRKVVEKFYHRRSFGALDRKLREAYKGANPYHLCRDDLKAAGESEIHAYGETPLRTLLYRASSIMSAYWA